MGLPDGAEAIELATYPSVSPDGEQFAFVWVGDVGVASINGGQARRLTSHRAEESVPIWSPDGTEIAFTSRRTGSWQVFVVPAEGGLPEQITHHSEGHFLCDWYPDGETLLVRALREIPGRDGARFYRIDRDGKIGEKMVFDAAGDNGRVSPDGSAILFEREGVDLYRKGYRGSQASQVWLWKNEKFRRLALEDRTTGACSPL